MARVLVNPDANAAIVTASRPEHLDDPVKAAELILDREILDRIDGGWATSLSGTPPKSNPSRDAFNSGLHGPGPGPGDS
ncbi:hypothetical protein BMF89_01930 [Arthrobacter sp. SRS-W-1-2016]|uniref:hypothetical protein n=1 Tax=Arthrobacter sp. SRS-W-1-2016 TaxID=1930254 RepID=UPI000990A0A5|nr:hypothetical protein [Arthrobacter sp. SRS-W-1-2016]OOP64917.1 hypothetical protein BMF89_01930 [Arthrobacter sp. SRS-W-1-2016]